MADLLEGQYELDGYLFGAGTPVILLTGGDVLEATTVRTQDKDNPRGDSIYFGRDYFNPPIRSFLFGITADGTSRFNDTDARPFLHDFRKAWRNDEVRLNPLAVSTLRWRLHGTTYRVYGRPRDFGVIEKWPRAKSRIFVQCNFQYRDAVAYADEEKSLTIGLISGSIGTGLRLPATLPWVLGQLNGQRSGVVNIGGYSPTPVKVTIAGPATGSATGIKVSGPGWALDFGSLSLPAGRTIVVDTNEPGSATINGVSIANYLTRQSTLVGKMNPGVHELLFAAADSSATTTTTISWRESVPLQ